MQAIYTIIFCTFSILTILCNVVLALPSLDTVRSFAFQLQDFSVAELAESQYDLLIIDYSYDGSSGRELTAVEVKTLQQSGKKVLAYLSIGEAEEYRFYFKKRWINSHKKGICGVKRSSKAPAWLDDANKNWCGNYKVRYWDRGWKRVIFGIRSGSKKSYLDRIIDAGFDGIYLDIIDGYDYWLHKKGASRRLSAATDMARFVISLGTYARNSRGISDFIVVPQNGAAIIHNLTQELKLRYLGVIQGIGAEDTFYFGDLDEDNPYAPQNDVLLILDEYINAGKKVLAIDYLKNQTMIDEFKVKACERGYLPQVGLRALNNLSYETVSGCQSL